MENRPLILVVDDEEPILKLLSVNLPVAGYDTIVASDGETALSLLEEQRPDLVILDITIPGLDGFQVLELIRERSSVPVIMLTGRDDVYCIKNALHVGADDYVIKPFSIMVLMARIRAKLRRAALCKV